MTGPRSPIDALSPGLDAMTRDAQRLAALYPALPAPAPSTWHPAPLDIPADAQHLAEAVPPYLLERRPSGHA